MSQPQVNAKLDMDTTPVSASLKKAEGQIASFGSRVGGKLRSGLRTAVTGAAGAMAAGVAATAGKSLSAGFDQMLNMENSEISMKSMLGSLDKAKQAMAMIGSEAAENPMFSKSELASTAQALVGFADKSTAKLHGLVEQAQLLSTLKPSAGLVGAAEALRDAIGGETERLKEYGFTGKELSGMKAKAGAGGDMTASIMAALEAKGINASTLNDMANSRQSQIKGLENQLANIGQGFYDALWPELGPKLQDSADWMKANGAEVVAGLKVVADGVTMLVNLTGKTMGWWDKSTEWMAEKWFDNDPGLIDHAAAGIGQIGHRGSFGEAARIAEGNLHGAQLGERSRDAVKAGQVPNMALTVRVQGAGVQGMMGAS